VFTKTQQPSLQEVLAAPSDAFIPIWQAFPADTETPISAFLKLRRGGTGFLLESAEQDGSIGRYSFIGVSPDAVLRAGLDRGTVETEAGIPTYEGDPLEALRRLAGEAPVHCPSPDIPGFVGGAVGMLSYELVHCLEKLPVVESGEPHVPVSLFGRYATLVIFDHLKQRILVVSVIPPHTSREEAYQRAAARVERVWAGLRRAPPSPPFETVESDVESLLESADKSPEDEAFVAAVARAREYVLAGDAIQVVLSHLPVIADPSHATGRREQVLPMARAAIAAGADGLMIEVHHDPDRSVSDGAQSLSFDQFDVLMSELRRLAPVLGRTV
jgi:anthranilate synthase component 1